MGDEARMETGTKKWGCGVIRSPEQFSGYSMEERGTSGKMKTLSSGNSTYWVVLVGTWESQMLRNVDCSHILEGLKYQWVGAIHVVFGHKSDFTLPVSWELKCSWL